MRMVCGNCAERGVAPSILSVLRGLVTEEVVCEVVIMPTLNPPDGVFCFK